jgi:hypothetical protein
MMASKLRQGWASHRTAVLGFAVVLMAIAASIWLGYQFWRLLWGEEPMWATSPRGAFDLGTFHGLVRRWFVGEHVYRNPRGSLYPPATCVLLWPLVGWLPFTPLRWLWATTSLLALAWLIRVVVRESGADSPVERAFVALVPLSMYATGATIGNGQLIVHLLPKLVAGLLLLKRGRGTWPEDLLATVLLLVSLVKPTVGIPFFWMVLFIPGRLRPALFVASGYGAASMLAASFQEQGLLDLLRDWLAYSAARVVGAGETNLHAWLGALGLEGEILLVSLLGLVFLGFWTHRHRSADPWLLMAVAAFIARFWTYHAWYDDLLLLLPMIALFRIAKRGQAAGGGDVAAGILLAAMMLTTLAPGGLYLLPPPWKQLFVAAQALVWLAVLGFLLDRARRDRVSGGPVCELTCQ